MQADGDVVHSPESHRFFCYYTGSGTGIDFEGTCNFIWM